MQQEFTAHEMEEFLNQLSSPTSEEYPISKGHPQYATTASTPNFFRGHEMNVKHCTK